MPPTNKQIEALARAFCEVQGLDPDMKVGGAMEDFRTRLEIEQHGLTEWYEDGHARWEHFRHMAFDRLCMDEAVRMVGDRG